MAESILDSDRPASATSYQRAAEPRWMQRVGWGMSGLMILFLLFDGASKLAMERHVVSATAAIGFPLDSIRLIGGICLL